MSISCPGVDAASGNQYSRVVQVRAPSVRGLEWALALLLTAAAIHLHWTFRSHAGALWRDEAASVNVSRVADLRELWRLTAVNSNPLLHPLLLRAAGAASPEALSDAGLRALGFAIGIGLLGALWAVAAALGTGPPVLSLALFGTLGGTVIWGDSVRPYGIGAILLLAAFASAWRLFERPGPARLALAALAASLAVQSVYQNAALVAAICLGGAAAALRLGRTRTAPWILASGAVAAASALPYIPVLAASRGWIALVVVPGFESVFINALRLLGSPHLVALPALWIGLLLAGLALGIAAATHPARPEFDPARQEPAVYAGATLLASMGFFLYFWVTKFATGPWNFLPFAALAAVCLDALSGCLADRTRAARVALAALLCVLGWAPSRLDVASRMTTIDALAAQLNRDATARDLVVVDPWFYGISFRRYYHGSAPFTTIPPIADLTLHRYDLVREQLTSADPMGPVLEQAARTLDGGGRVWVVGHMSLTTVPAPGLAPAPHPRTGVSETPYLWIWSWRLGHFLRTRGDRFHITGAPGGPASSWETVGMVEVQKTRRQSRR